MGALLQTGPSPPASSSHTALLCLQLPSVGTADPPTLTSFPTCKLRRPKRWKRCCRKHNLTRVAARLQQKGPEPLHGPLSVSAKYRCFQVIYNWAMLNLN